MSPLLLYGIRESDRARPLGSGLEGRPLRGVVCGPLLAVVCEQDGLDLEPTPAALRQYERAMGSLMALGAILPARFATVIADDAQVRALLEERQEDLLARLRRVEGAVEIALRACGPASAAGPSIGQESGTAYMRERLELRARAARVGRALDPLGDLALSARRALAPRRDVLVLDAYLVDERRVEDFLRRVEELDTRLEDADLICTGPWPPYSFAQGEPI